MSTAEAGRLVGIKQTSACRIINSYKKHNRIFERKADRVTRQNDSPDHEEQKHLKILEQDKANQPDEGQKRQDTPSQGPSKQENKYPNHDVTIPRF